jgi:hypothetical protein
VVFSSCPARPLAFAECSSRADDAAWSCAASSSRDLQGLSEFVSERVCFGIKFSSAPGFFLMLPTDRGEILIETGDSLSCLRELRFRFVALRLNRRKFTAELINL